MIRNMYSTAIVALLTISTHAHAFVGQASPGVASADYDPATGRMSVSVNGVNSWYIESASSSLTSDAPMGIPAIGGLLTDNDLRIGETHLFVYGYTDIDLGNVAATGLPSGDLVINWFTGLGTPQQQQPVAYSFNPNGTPNVQPTAQIESPGIVDLSADPLNITLDASNSTDDGALVPLTYTWDLDGDGTYETSSGSSATLDIANVLTTFGGAGDYSIAVRAFDGEFNSFRALTTLKIVGVIPEPAATTLALAATLFLVGRRHRR